MVVSEIDRPHFWYTLVGEGDMSITTLSLFHIPIGYAVCGLWIPALADIALLKIHGTIIIFVSWQKEKCFWVMESSH